MKYRYMAEEDVGLKALKKVNEEIETIMGKSKKLNGAEIKQGIQYLLKELVNKADSYEFNNDLNSLLVFVVAYNGLDDALNAYDTSPKFVFTTSEE